MILGNKRLRDEEKEEKGWMFLFFLESLIGT